MVVEFSQTGCVVFCRGGSSLGLLGEILFFRVGIKSRHPAEYHHKFSVKLKNNMQKITVSISKHYSYCLFLFESFFNRYFWSFWPPQAWLLLLQSQEPSLIWGNSWPKPPKTFSHFSSKLLKPTLSTLSTMVSRLNPRQVEEDMDLVLVPGNHNMDENDVQLYTVEMQ